MAKLDLSVMNLDDDGNATFKIYNTGGRAVSTDKTIQHWLKLYYNNTVRQLAKSKSAADMKAIINIGMTDTNNTLRELQTTQELTDKEEFVGCSIKSLDIDENTKIVTLELNFKTVANTTVISV